MAAPAVYDVNLNTHHRHITRLCGIAAFAISVAVAVGTVFNIDYPARLLVTVVFALVVPGWACVSYLGFAERLVEMISAVALSISMGLLLALIQIQVHAWHPELVVASWAGVSAVLVAKQIAYPSSIRRAQPDDND